VDLETVTGELYALPPQDFTGVRNERVKEARSSGNRDLAAAIGSLRRPSTSAWVVNLLARERTDLIDQLSGLADALRAAQATLSGPELRSLSTQRKRVIASVVAEARKLAAGQGVKVSDPTERELEATFDAALADPQAAEAVRSGRLESALSYAGLGAGPTGAPSVPKPQPTAAPKRSSKPDAAAQRRQREEARRAAEQALRDAEAEAERAAAELEEARDAADRAEAERDAAHQRIADLTEQLEQAQAEASAAAPRIRERQRTRTRAEHRAEEAQRHLDRAQRAAADVG
jgi:hypothetical protein